MKTCKDCLHYELCIHLSIANIGKDVDVACAFFKDRSLCIDLPCVSGTTIYSITQPCKCCEYFETIVERCRNCAQTEIIECKIYYDLISDFGKTLFLSREDAEIALEANKNEKV